MDLRHPELGAYTLEQDGDMVFVEFDTDADYIDASYFPVTEDGVVLVSRTTGQHFIEVLEANGFEVGYNAYF